MSKAKIVLIGLAVLWAAAITIMVGFNFYVSLEIQHGIDGLRDWARNLYDGGGEVVWLA